METTWNNNTAINCVQFQSKNPKLKKTYLGSRNWKKECVWICINSWNQKKIYHYQYPIHNDPSLVIWRHTHDETNYQIMNYLSQRNAQWFKMSFHSLLWTPDKHQSDNFFKIIVFIYLQNFANIFPNSMANTEHMS